MKMATETFTRMDLETLERLIDAYGLNCFLENAANICHEKAEHVMSSYNDPLTAATWDQASTNLMVASEFVFSKALTIRAGNSISPLDTLDTDENENIGSVKP
jgi:hypothetical protein